MMDFRGNVVSGAGIATRMTQLDWFRSAVEKIGGFVPVPGTLNLRIGAVASFQRMLLRSGTVLVPPKESHCCAFLLGTQMVLAGGGECRGLIVRPLTPNYADSTVEVVAPVHVRSQFGLRDGDSLRLKLEALPGPRFVRAPLDHVCDDVVSGWLSEQVLLGDTTVPLEALWVATGEGVMAALVGGKAHLGAVAQAVPRPSLVDPSRRSSTSSVLTLPGHKDDVVARLAAELLAARLGQNAAVAAGVHVGPPGRFGLGEEDLEKVLAGVRALAERMAQELSALTQREW